MLPDVDPVSEDKSPGRSITSGQKTLGSLFTDINNLDKQLKAEDEDAEDAEEREKEKFNENTIAGRIARNKYFEYSTLGVIVFNALYLGYDCDYNARWGKPEDLYSSSLWGFMLFDNFFCAFFTFELLVRFVGYKSKFTACTDFSFIFDLLLVTMMIVETWILAFLGPIDALKQVSILRLLRLTRLLRMGKLMRYFPELSLIVKGMVAAVRSVGCAAILMVLVLYVFAIIFTQEYHQGLKADDDEDLTGAEVLFGSIGKSLRHLFNMAVILDDITACTNTIRTSGQIHLLFAFIVCVLISSFTLFNMLLGILCEVVEATQNYEQEKADASKLHDTMTQFFKAMDVDGNGEISKSEFLQMHHDKEVMGVLASMDINTAEFDKYAEILFTPEHEGQPDKVLDYAHAVAMMNNMRPGHSINCCDFKLFEKMVKTQNREIEEYLEAIEALLDEATADEDDLEMLDHPHEFAQDGEVLSPRSTKRPVATLGRLARSGVSRAAVAPKRASRWVDEFPDASQPGAGSPRGSLQIGDEIVTERLQNLVDRKRSLNKEIRDMTYGTTTSSYRIQRQPYGSYPGSPVTISPVLDVTQQVSGDSDDDSQPPGVLPPF
jgi:voltage-gated sodium channel